MVFFWGGEGGVVGADCNRSGRLGGRVKGPSGSTLVAFVVVVVVAVCLGRSIFSLGFFFCRRRDPFKDACLGYHCELP